MDYGREIADVEYGAIKDKHYLGVARVDLSSLSFDHPLNHCHRETSQKAIDRLRKIYRVQGCLRYQDEHFLNGIICRDALDESLAEGGLGVEGYDYLTRKEDGTIPYLPLLNVNCLHGLHRVRAAEKFLDDDDQWWIVRLYADDITPAAARRIVEEYANSAPYTDGEAFWRIRTYHHAHDKIAEQRWWARLSPTKRKDLKHLLKNRGFRNAFDALLGFPGLWRPIKLGTLHRLHALKCDEEMLRYLKHIRTVWDRITGAMPGDIVDAETVERLQLLAPRSRDFRIVRKLMLNQSLFPNVTRKSERNSLLHNLRQVSCLIPSLHTFFENLKYLEPCCLALRSLLPAKHRKTIQQALGNAYATPERPLVETARGHAFYEASGSSNDQRRAYHQLWLFAMRHFPELTTHTPRKDPNRSRPLPRGPNPLFLGRLGALSQALGFRTRQAMELCENDPEAKLIVEFLHRAAVESPSASQVNAISALLESIRAEPADPSNSLEDVSMSSDYDSATDSDESPSDGAAAATGSLPRSSLVPVDKRCGRPFQTDHYADRNKLYLDSLCAMDDPVSKVTSLVVKRDLLQAFLGISDYELPYLSELTTPVDTADSFGSDASSASGAASASASDSSSDPGLLARVRELEQKEDALKTSVHLKDNQLQQLRQEHQSHQQRLDSHANQERKCRQRLEALEGQLHESEDLRRIQEAEQQEWQKDLSKVRTEKAGLTDERNDLQRNVEDLNKKLEEAENGLADLRARYDDEDLTGKKRSTRSLQSKDELLQGLNGPSDAIPVHDNEAMLVDETATNQPDHTDCWNERVRLQHIIDDQKQQLQSYETDALKHQKVHEQEQEEQEHTINQLHSEIRSQQSRIEAGMQEQQDRELNIVELRSEVEASARKQQDQEHTISELQEQYNQSHLQLQAYEHENSKLDLFEIEGNKLKVSMYTVDESWKRAQDLVEQTTNKSNVTIGVCQGEGYFMHLPYKDPDSIWNAWQKCRRLFVYMMATPSRLGKRKSPTNGTTQEGETSQAAPSEDTPEVEELAEEKDVETLVQARLLTGHAIRDEQDTETGNADQADEAQALVLARDPGASSTTREGPSKRRIAIEGAKFLRSE